MGGGFARDRCSPWPDPVTSRLEWGGCGQSRPAGAANRCASNLLGSSQTCNLLFCQVGSGRINRFHCEMMLVGFINRGPRWQVQIGVPITIRDRCAPLPLVSRYPRGYRRGPYNRRREARHAASGFRIQCYGARKTRCKSQYNVSPPKHCIRGSTHSPTSASGVAPSPCTAPASTPPQRSVMNVDRATWRPATGSTVSQVPVAGDGRGDNLGIVEEHHPPANARCAFMSWSGTRTTLATASTASSSNPPQSPLAKSTPASRAPPPHPPRSPKRTAGFANKPYGKILTVYQGHSD